MKALQMKTVLLFAALVAGSVAPAWADNAAQPSCPLPDKTAAAAAPASGEKAWGEHARKMHEEMDKKLGLTDDQKAKLKAFGDENRANMKAVREKMKTTRESLREALDSPTVDSARITQLAGDLKQQFAEMVDLRLKAVSAMRSVLTPEQFATMKKIRAERMDRIKKRMGDKHQEGKGPHGMKDDEGGFLGF